MRVRLLVTAFLLACAAAIPARANDTWMAAFESQYPAAAGTRIDDCLLCHTVSGRSARNVYGTAYGNASHNFTTIENLDSDGDGSTNLAEITALTFPGNATDKPTAATGSLTVTISPAGAVTAGAQWRVGTTGTYQNSGTTLGGLAVGAATVQFKAVSGWTAPGDQSVTITAGGTASTSGTYTQILVAVPNVIGQTQAAASTQIVGANLVVGTITQTYSATVPSGTVISQTPSAGSSVSPGSAVLLTVSRGVQPVITGSVIINKGAMSTSSTSVTLSLTWSSNAVRMRFSDNGANWTAWEPLTAARACTLPVGDGYKTVRVQFLDIANNHSSVYSDYILLDTAPPTGSILINNGAQATATAAVTLNLTWADAGSGVTHMRFSNDGMNWTLWEPVKAAKAHTLPGPAGVYNTVRVQYRDAAGNYSAVCNDYIKVDAL